MAATTDDVQRHNIFGATTHSIPISIQAAALYILYTVLLSVLISATPGLIGNDDYYHVRMGDEIIVQGRLAVEFPWLPKTILSPDKFVDHHLLYHLYIAPWMHWGGIAGAKFGQVAVAAGVFLAVWLLLRQIGARYPALWSLAMFGLSSPFLYRMLMIRTQGASLLLLILALLVLFQRRYIWLMLLSFAYAWLYNGFILMPTVTVLYVAAVWLTERRVDLRPIVYSLFGITFGIVINPYFPRNVEFLAEHLGAKVDFESGVRVGSEWYPYTTGALLTNSAGALLVLAFGLLRPGLGGQRDRITMTLLFVALLTLFMLFRSRRFIEYYPPFALLFCAAVWGRHSSFPFWMFSRRLVRLARVFAITIVGAFVVTTFADAHQLIKAMDNQRRFEGASNWLKTNTPAGTPVFQLDWDDFTHLFYNNTRNTYLVGLDPTYLERAEPDLWKLWVDITRGEVESPSRIIRERFGSLYIVGDRQHTDFEDRATEDADIVLVYWDANSMIWRISE